MTSAWLVEQSWTVRTFSHDCAWLIGVYGPQCIRCVRYLIRQKTPGSM